MCGDDARSHRACFQIILLSSTLMERPPLVHFIHTAAFEKAAQAAAFTDAELRALQLVLMRNPDAGDQVPGAGGVRKVRVPHPQRGKGTRGGLRVIYYVVSARATVYLLYLFSKGEFDDVSEEGKRLFKALTARLDREPGPSR